MAPVNARYEPRSTTRPVERVCDTVITIRPTLIVGLGGTGVLIVQWAHQLIRELFGTIPPFVKFLGLDTDVQEEGGPRQILPPSDFINLFDGFHLGEVLRDWYRARRYHRHLRWLEEMQLDAAIADRGAQGVSRLGRVVFFETWQQIHRAVIARYDALNGNNIHEETAAMLPQNQFILSETPLIHLAASVCGGTGSGLLLDLAYALREWANGRFYHEGEVLAHLVLPEAFGIVSQVILDKLRAVAGSTLEQIELLMDSRRRDIEVSYPNGMSRRFETTRAPFDACFLINGYGPGGGDDRLHLVQMIGRMIRAMTVEPASKTIASDLNNKRQDILRNKDDRTCRRLCFASYGLRYGTAGIPNDRLDTKQNRVKRWMCISLGKAAGESADEHMSEHVRAKIKQLLVPAALVAPLKAVTQPAYAWPTIPSPTPANFDPNEAVRQSVQAHMDEIKRRLQQRADQGLYSGRDVNALCEASLAEEVQRGAAEAGQPAKPATLARSYAFLQVAAQELKAQIEALRLTNADTAKDGIATEIMKRLHAEAGQAGAGDLMGLDPTQGEAAVNRIRDHYYDWLCGVVAAPAYKALSQGARAACDNGVKALESLADVAAAVSRKFPSDEDLRLFAQCPYATSLFELTHPDESDSEELRPTREFFHKELVVRTGRDFLAKWAPHQLPDQQAAQLETLLAAQAERIESFLSECEKEHDNNFRKAANPRDPSAHPFYVKVVNVADRARAKVAIDKTNRYSRPLDVVVAQHCQDSCIRGLMETLGRDSRSAFVSKEFKEFTNIWVQLMNFQYGFSLPALANYEEYRAARDRYLKRSGFEAKDLLLDPDWVDDYETLRELCDKEVRRRLVPRPGGAAPPNAQGAATPLSQLNDALQTLLVGLYRECRKRSEEFRSERNFTESIGVIFRCRDAARERFEIARDDKDISFADVKQFVGDQVRPLQEELRDIDPRFVQAAEPLFNQFRATFNALPEN